MAGRRTSDLDVHIGEILLQYRHEAGLSQEAVAEALGLTFQQIQKYERGSNRVSVSRLIEYAMILGFQFQEFFDQLPEQYLDADKLRAIQAGVIPHPRHIKKPSRTDALAAKRLSELPPDLAASIKRLIATLHKQET